MRYAFILLLGNALPLALTALAAWIIYLDRDGWGWCVVAALFCAVVPTEKDKNKENNL